MPLNGKKKNLTRNMLIDYFGKEKCDLTDKVIVKVLDTIISAIPRWRKAVGISFLSDNMKEKYIDLMDSRLERLRLL